MKVLWITNNLMPDASIALGDSPSVLGGWMVSSANELVKNSHIELICATVSNKTKKLIKLRKGLITYFIIPLSKSNIKYNSELQNFWQKIQDAENPDVVHIHGTEFAHGLAWIKACGNANVVASIQGLTSVYYRYSTGSLSVGEILRSVTISDIKNQTSIFHLSRNFRKRGVIEEEYIRSLQFIIGRTEWDRSHALSVNNNIKYLYCNETLRSSFYNGRWELSKCEKHSIFLSQARSPIKGLHIMLKALPLILRKYPDVKLYVGNSVDIRVNTLKQKLRQSGYYWLILKMIQKMKLDNNVFFLPALNEQEMRDRFLRSHVFVNASSIENSPNSLGEAQILGVPCVSSYVGGTPEFMGYGKAGALYRFEEYEMLADAVCRVFEKGYFQSEIDEGLHLANERHDPQINMNQLLNIYRCISGKIERLNG